MNLRIKTNTKVSPELEFLRKLWRLNHAMEVTSSHLVRRLGVTAQQRLMIRFIGANPGLTSGQLATELHLDPGTISTAVRRMEARGLLVRRRGADRRQVILDLGPLGKMLNKPDDATVESAVAQVLKNQDPGVCAAGTRLLDALTHELESAWPATDDAKTRSDKVRK